MAANQVVLYFEKPEDALLFTLAASSVMSAEGPVHSSKAAVRVAQNLQSQSNHDGGCTQCLMKGGKIR